MLDCPLLLPLSLTAALHNWNLYRVSRDLAEAGARPLHAFN